MGGADRGHSMCLLDATTINDIGDTLLHNACRDDESLAFISLLLEKYPAAAKKRITLETYHFTRHAE
eukprot:1578635-Ditylum_brightwellii.AAC.1